MHAQGIPSSMCSDCVPRPAKTVEPDTESQDCDFEPKVSQTSLAQINTEDSCEGEIVLQLYQNERPLNAIKYWQPENSLAGSVG